MSGHLIDWIPVQAKRIVQEQQAKEAAARREEVRRAEAEAKRIEAPIPSAFSKGRKEDRTMWKKNWNNGLIYQILRS